MVCMVLSCLQIDDCTLKIWSATADSYWWLCDAGHESSFGWKGLKIFSMLMVSLVYIIIYPRVRKQHIWYICIIDFIQNFRGIRGWHLILVVVSYSHWMMPFFAIVSITRFTWPLAFASQVWLLFDCRFFIYGRMSNCVSFPYSWPLLQLLPLLLPVKYAFRRS